MYRYYFSLRSSTIYSIAVGRCIFLFFVLKGKYVLWEKQYIPHVIVHVEYDLYPLSLVNSQV